MGKMDWMSFQLYIQRINIICVWMFNHQRDGCKSIGQFIMYSRSMCELDLMKSFAQLLHVLYVRYNLGSSQTILLGLDESKDLSL